MTKRNLFLVLVVFSICVGCEDFIEEDISGESIVIVAPPDNFQTSSATITFWWNELDGAETYEVQIVKGTFSFVQQYITDTSTTLDQFEYSLQPGNYEWRVKGVNNGYETPFTTHSLVIDSTLDLTNQQVALTSPPANHITTETEITFSWMELYNAEEYRFQILDSSSGATITDITITQNTYTYILSEGSYLWQVRAINAGSITPASQRNLIIDLSPPNAPTLVSPLHNAVLTAGNTDSLVWNSDPVSIGDTLYLATDSTFINVEFHFSSSEFFILNQVPGNYFWKVKSKDIAGNESAFSPYRKFTIQ